MYNNANMYNPYLTVGLQRQEVIRVNGRNGAEAYQMAPNSSVLLLDETTPVVWLKTTDGASYPTITGYTITPIKPKETEVAASEVNDYSKLEARIKKLEEIINAKSDVGKVRPSKATTSDK